MIVEKMNDIIPSEDVQVILGDFNAKLGKEECYKDVYGENTVHENTNDDNNKQNKIKNI